MRRALSALVLGASLYGAAPAIAQPSAAPAAGEDIHDIRGAIEIPDRWGWVPFAVAGSLGAAAVAVVARRLARRSAPPRTPAEIALERLARAEAEIPRTLPASFSEAVSAAVRDYIESRFQLRAGSRTTDEFLRDLAARESSPLGPHREGLGAFLEACDLAKFARARLSPGDMGDLCRSARRFIVDTARPEALQEAMS